MKKLQTRVRGYAYGNNEDEGTKVSTRKRWMKTFNDICNNFILGEEICPDLVFGQMFSISKALFRQMRTELVVFRPDIWVPINESWNGTDVSKDSRILSVLATIGYGEYSCIGVMGNIIKKS